MSARRLRALAVAVGVAASIGMTTACDRAPTLEDRDWTLVALGREPVPEPTERGAPYLHLVSENAQMQGFGGCNRIFGSYSLEGSRLEFGPVAGTRMACPDAPAEPGFMAALAATRTYQLTGSVLLFKDDAAAVARFEAAQPD
ncbi:MAG: META domain-containing protein [Deltaproteobacteria bacterium]|nr:META domain-containing protein [Deltaproteobacteria bacterium]MBW2416441.1 META domain-containing protein [Deltaproteobacteria bacterium]